MANMLQLIQSAKYYAKSRQLDEDNLTTETDTALPIAFWVDAINRSQNYHMNLVIQAAQDYFMTKTTVSFVSGTERYDLPGNSIKIRYVEKTDIDPDEVIKPINIDQRLEYTDQEDDDDDDDALDHFAYLFNRSIGIVPNMNTGDVSLFYIRRLPDLSYGIVSATPTTTQVRLAATPIFGKSSNEDDHYNGSRIRIDGKISEITDYSGSNRACTVVFTTAPATSAVYDIICEIPEEYHNAVSMYAALLARARDNQDMRNVQMLHQDLLRQMTEGLTRWDNKGKIVNYQDL